MLCLYAASGSAAGGGSPGFQLGSPSNLPSGSSLPSPLGNHGLGASLGSTFLPNTAASTSSSVSSETGAPAPDGALTARAGAFDAVALAGATTPPLYGGGPLMTALWCLHVFKWTAPGLFFQLTQVHTTPPPFM